MTMLAVINAHSSQDNLNQVDACDGYQPHSNNLLMRLQAGDQTAYDELVQRYGPRLYAVAFRMLRSHADAEDAVQQSWLSAYRSIDRFESRSTLGTWLHRIVVNTCLMSRRRLGRGPHSSLDELMPALGPECGRCQRISSWKTDAATTVVDGETRLMVRECLTELPSHFRTIIRLRDLEGFDTQTTAALLDVSKAVVKTRLHRARQALKELLCDRLECA